MVNLQQTSPIVMNCTYHIWLCIIHFSKTNNTSSI